MLQWEKKKGGIFLLYSLLTLYKPETALITQELARENMVLTNDQYNYWIFFRNYIISKQISWFNQSNQTTNA